MAFATGNLYSKRIYDYDFRDFQRQGAEHFRAKRFETALYYFQKAERNAKRNRSATKQEMGKLWGLIGDCFAKTGKKFEATDYYKKSLEKDEVQNHRLRFLAIFYAKRRRYNESLNYFSWYAGLEPNDYKTRLEHVKIHALENTPREAQGLIKKANAAHQCTLPKKIMEKDINCLEKSFLENPGNPENAFAYVRALSGANQEKKAREIADWLNIVYGENFRYAWPAITLFYHQKKYKKSEKILQKILKSDPENKLALELYYAIAIETDREFLATNILEKLSAIENPKQTK